MCALLCKLFGRCLNWIYQPERFPHPNPSWPTAVPVHAVLRAIFLRVAMQLLVFHFLWLLSAQVPEGRV